MSRYVDTGTRYHTIHLHTYRSISHVAGQEVSGSKIWREKIDSIQITRGIKHLRTRLDIGTTTWQLFAGVDFIRVGENSTYEFRTFGGGKTRITGSGILNYYYSYVNLLSSTTRRSSIPPNYYFLPPIYYRT